MLVHEIVRVSGVNNRVSCNKQTKLKCMTHSPLSVANGNLMLSFFLPTGDS